MYRRQVISHDDWVRDEFNTPIGQMRSPRKWRTYDASNQFQDTIYYKNQHLIPKPNDPESAWIGKILVEWDGDSIWSYAKHLHSMHNPLDPTKEKHALPYSPGYGPYVFEYEIARYARGRIYRILYATPNPKMKSGYTLLSKPAIEMRPGRMNLIVNPKNNIILAVEYF